MELTQEYLKQYFTYNKKTGDFYRIKSECGYRKTKTKYKPNAKGYYVANIKRRPILVHRLIWLYVFGYMPKQIDHINHIKTDNRLENLRDVTNLENHKNMPLFKDNKSGYTGVSKTINNTWRARITINKKELNLGYYKTKEEAISARKKAEVLYGFHKNHGKTRSVSPI